MFPGAVGNGTPVYTIQGDGFVDGAFVAEKEISVTATGFPDGTNAVAAIAWIPTEPSTGDVNLDFWRDFLNGCVSGNIHFNCPLVFGAGFNPPFVNQPQPGVQPTTLMATGVAPAANMNVWVYHVGFLDDPLLNDDRFFFGYGAYRLNDFVASVNQAAAVLPAPTAALTPSVSCVPLTPTVGVTVTCTVTGGDAGIDIRWRAAYNPVFAEANMTLDGFGAGTFSFIVPGAALGRALTLELVGLVTPMPLGIVGPTASLPVPSVIPVPTSVPTGEGRSVMGALALIPVAILGLLVGSVRPGRRRTKALRIL